LPLSFREKLPKFIVPKSIALLSKLTTQDNHENNENGKLVSLLILVSHLAVDFSKCEEVQSIFKFLYSLNIDTGLQDRSILDIQFQILNAHPWLIRDLLKWMKESNAQRKGMYHVCLLFSLIVYFLEEYARLSEIITMSWNSSETLMKTFYDEKAILQEVIENFV
jgi:hypothetical protein